MAGQTNLQYEQNQVNSLEGQLGIGPDAPKKPRGKPGKSYRRVPVTPRGSSVDHHPQMPAPHRVK